jgi:hypothetical protein
MTSEWINRCRRITKLCTFVLPVILFGCKERFDADINFADTGFLVVEGYINIGSKAVTLIKLSRTTPIDEDNDRVPEKSASVAIENSAGETFQLLQLTDGNYISDSLNLPVDELYRLKISIADKIYFSEFVKPLETPEIDSVSWNLQPNGVSIGVSTHDDINHARQYLWEFDEIWEVKSPRLSLYSYVNSTWVNRTADEIKNMQTCWKYTAITGLNVQSTKSYSQNLVLNHPIKLIPLNDERLSERYSIVVRQRSLSDDAYDYIQLILSNSENLGTLFDPLPGELTGNIYCSSTSEPVVGLIDAATTESKQIFIYNTDIPSWNYTINCEDTLLMFNAGANLDLIMKAYAATQYHYTEPLVRDGVYITSGYCADCRIQGGTNIRPSFWEFGAD